MSKITKIGGNIFQNTISRVKFSVEFKSELRKGVKKRKSCETENKQKNEDFKMKIDISLLVVVP